jgi:hypothetical protein
LARSSTSSMWSHPDRAVGAKFPGSVAPRWAVANGVGARRGHRRCGRESGGWDARIADGIGPA